MHPYLYWVHVRSFIDNTYNDYYLLEFLKPSSNPPGRGTEKDSDCNGRRWGAELQLLSFRAERLLGLG